MKHLVFVICTCIACLVFCSDSSVAPAPDAGSAPPAALTWERTTLPLDAGITTTSEDFRGNWHEKLKFFKEARQAYEQLRVIALETDTLMPQLDKKRDALVALITQFVQAYSLKEGAIEEQLNELEKLLEKERRKDVQLTEQERNELTEVKDKKKELEFLKKDTMGFNEIIFGLDKAFATAQQQMVRAKEYEQKGWELYDKIADVLNDELAEEMYLTIKGNITNVSLINSYLKNDLVKYLEQTEQLLKDHITKISTRIDALQQRGIILLAQNQEEQAQLLEKQKQAEEEQKRKEAAQRSQGWWSRVIQSVSSLWNWITHSLQTMTEWVTSWFIKSKPVEPVAPVQDRATNPAPRQKNGEKA